jgi:hypothetical protein
MVCVLQNGGLFCSMAIAISPAIQYLFSTAGAKCLHFAAQKQGPLFPPASVDHQLAANAPTTTIKGSPLSPAYLIFPEP